MQTLTDLEKENKNPTRKHCISHYVSLNQVFALQHYSTTIVEFCFSSNDMRSV